VSILDELNPSHKANNFFDRINEGVQSPLFQFGAALLANSGPQAVQQGTLANIGHAAQFAGQQAEARQQAQFKNQILQAQLRASQQDREFARRQQERQIAASAALKERANAMLGPEMGAFASALIDSDPRQGGSFMANLLKPQDQGVDTLKDMLALQQARFDLESAQKERDTADRNKTSKVGAAIRDLQQAAQLSEFISREAAASGTEFDEFTNMIDRGEAFVRTRFNLEPSVANDLVAAREGLDRLSDSVVAATSETLSNPTNARVALIEGSKFSTRQTPTTQAASLAALMREQRGNVVALGLEDAFPLSDIDAFIRQQEERARIAGASGAPNPKPRPSILQRFGGRRLDQLTQSEFATITPEEYDAMTKVQKQTYERLLKKFGG